MSSVVGQELPLPFYVLEAGNCNVRTEYPRYAHGTFCKVACKVSGFLAQTQVEASRTKSRGTARKLVAGDWQARQGYDWGTASRIAASASRRTFSPVSTFGRNDETSLEKVLALSAFNQCIAKLYHLHRNLKSASLMPNSLSLQM